MVCCFAVERNLLWSGDNTLPPVQEAEVTIPTALLAEYCKLRRISRPFWLEKISIKSTYMVGIPTFITVWRLCDKEFDFSQVVQVYCLFYKDFFWLTWSTYSPHFIVAMFWGNSISSLILTIRWINKGVRTKYLEVTLLFVNFSKAFDSILWRNMEQILWAYGLPKEAIKDVIMLYKNRKTLVYSPDGDANFFDILTGILQGDTLAPYLFIICLE